MQNRLLKKGIITTVLGIAILGASFFMWMTGRASQNESMLMVGIGLIFLRSKDSLIGINKKK